MPAHIGWSKVGWLLGKNLNYQGKLEDLSDQILLNNCFGQKREDSLVQLGVAT